MVDKGDIAWMFLSTVLVMLMIVPGLALFYGGLVRAKNILSVLMQVLVVASLALVLWVAYGYSLAFDGGNAWIGGFGKAMLAGVGPSSTVPTFTQGVVIPELAYIAFQGAFAAISCALVVGAIAERAKLAAVLLFAALWFTFAYLPLAHMVWAGNGFLFKLGALDFAGGTVVHINAGVAGLVGAYMLGPRIGFGRERLSPHNLPLTYRRRVAAVGRLVRIQRGLGAGSQRRGCARLRQHLARRRGCGAGVERDRSAPAWACVDVGCRVRRRRGIGRDHAGMRHRRRGRRDGDRRVRWRGWVLGRQRTQAPSACGRFARRLRHPWGLRHRRRRADRRVHRADARRNRRRGLRHRAPGGRAIRGRVASRSCGRVSSHSSHSRSPSACAACAWTTTASAKAWTSAPMANRRTKSDRASHRRRAGSASINPHA